MIKKCNAGKKNPIFSKKVDVKIPLYEYNSLAYSPVGNAFMNYIWNINWLDGIFGFISDGTYQTCMKLSWNCSKLSYYLMTFMFAFYRIYTLAPQRKKSQE